MSLELIPAIDLLGGRVVRLHRGDYDAVTDYGADPAAQAEAFAAAGAKRLHVVDLEGARSGAPAHLDVMASILARTSLEVQVGGGIRTAEIAERWLAAGAARVVIGTAAVRAPQMVAKLCADHRGRIVIAVDGRGEEVAVEGWREGSGKAVLDLAREADGWGAAALLYTDVARDGTGEGPAVVRTAALQAEVSATVIASGGIGGLSDVVALREAGVRAAVCGRALYDGAFSLEAGLRAAAGEG